MLAVGVETMIMISSMGHQVFWLSSLMLSILDTENCFKEYLLLHISHSLQKCEHSGVT